MGLYDRQYYRDDDDKGGSIKQAFRKIFVEGTNFFEWSLFLYRAWGIEVRIHVFFVAWLVFELLGTLFSDPGYFWFVAYSRFALFAIVLLHEYGHCFAARAVGGSADRILLWPLGGLATCSPPNTWKANLITTLGGPAVNVALIPVLGGVLLLVGGGLGSILFNPFTPMTSLGLIEWGGGAAYWKIGLWWAYYMNLILLAFNMLIPMFPMDAGRTVQNILWGRIGYEPSMKIAVNLGLVVAGLLGVFAMTQQNYVLLSIAVFGALICWQTRQQLMMLDPMSPAYSGAGPAFGAAQHPASDEKRKYKQALEQQRKTEAEQAEVDRILAKIASNGMQSLTRKEKATLRKATERTRKDS